MRRALALLLAFLLLPLAALAQQQETDRGYIQGLLEDALSAPGRSVRMEGFAGALSSRATIKRITVTDPQGLWLAIDDVVLVWNRTALLQGRVEIDEISAKRIELPRPPVPQDSTLPAPEARGAFSLPELPVSLNIAKMKIDRAVLGAAILGQAAEMGFTGNAALETGTGKAALELTRLDKQGRFAVTGAFDNTSRVLGLDLDLSEPADGIAASLLGLPGKPSVRLSLQGEDPIADFTARVRLATDGRERLGGRVTLATDASGATRFAVDLGGDVAPVLVPDFAAFLGDQVQLAAQGARAADGALALDRLRITTAALTLDGHARIGADGWPRDFTLDTAIRPPAGDSVVLPLPGARTAIAGATFTAAYDAAAGEAWRIDGRLSGLTQPGLALATAGFAANGTLDRANERVAGRLSLDAAGIAPDDPALARAIGQTLQGALAFDWQKGAPLRLSAIDLAGVDYGLTGKLDIDGLEQIETLALVPDVTLSARDLTRFADLVGLDLTGAAHLGIGGRVEPLTGRLALAFDGATRDLATGIARLDPLLAGDGHLSLGLNRDETGTNVDPLLIRSDFAHFDGAAVLRSGRSTVQLRAQLPEVARVLPEMHGAASLTLDAAQNGEVWTIKAETSLPGETRAGFDGTVTLAGQAEGTLKAEVAQLAALSGLVKRRLAGAATLSATGRVDLQTGGFDVNASGRTRGLTLAAPLIDPYLRGETAVILSAARDGDGMLAIRDLALRGAGLDADLDGTLGLQDGRLNYRVAIGNLGAVVPELPGAATLSGTAARTGNGAAWQIDASATGPGGIAATAAGRIAQDLGRVDLSLAGSAPLSLANPRLSGQALTGVARFDLAVNGPPELNSLSGRVSLADGRLAIPARNLALNRIRGEARLAGGAAQLALDADVSSGGSLTLAGPVTLSPPFDARLIADLRAVTLRETALFEAQLGGRITVDGPLTGGARIGGRIDVATAELRIPQLGPSYSPLQGLRHINATPAVRRTLSFAGLESDAAAGARAALPGYPLDLAIRAPARVFVRGRGLDAELGGALVLGGSTDAIVPSGGFELIRGRLDLLGRRLTLTEGSLQLRGSFDPVIAFAATSQVEDVAISLRLDGLASAPDLTVSAVPDMPQEEALSFFLFGRDITQISALQAVQLAAAIRTLSGSGGTGLTEKLRKSFGVDELDLATDADGVAEARVGKYLSEKLYTDVTVKGDGTSEVNLNLDINPRLKLRGRLGNDGDTGIGLFFEKDY